MPLIIEGQEPDCECDERFLVGVDGRRLRQLPGQHNCAYIRARNKLIPLAEAAANRDVPEEVVRDRYGSDVTVKRGPRWVRTFFEHMSRLALERIHRAA